MDAARVWCCMAAKSGAALAYLLVASCSWLDFEASEGNYCTVTIEVTSDECEVEATFEYSTSEESAESSKEAEIPAL